jgi:hypothetical protein
MCIFDTAPAPRCNTVLASLSVACKLNKYTPSNDVDHSHPPKFLGYSTPLLMPTLVTKRVVTKQAVTRSPSTTREGTALEACK